MKICYGSIQLRKALKFAKIKVNTEIDDIREVVCVESNFIIITCRSIIRHPDS